MGSYKQTFTHTFIPTQPCTLLKQRKCTPINSLNTTLLFTAPLPLQCSGSVADAPKGCFTLEALPPRTVLTENICQNVQKILQHDPAKMPFLTTSTITHPPMHTPKATKSKTLNSPNTLQPSISCPLPVQCGGGQPSGSLADVPQG